MSHPASVDSTPTSANQEDHVSMACHGARRLIQMNENLAGIVGIETLCALQGIDLRGPLKTSVALNEVHAAVRAVVPMLGSDRFMANDLNLALQLVSSGKLARPISGEIIRALAL